MKQGRTLAHLTVLGVPDVPPVTAVRYDLIYYFKTAVRWDEDNAIAAAKCYLDGIAAALRCDDQVFSFGTLTMAKDRARPRLAIVMVLNSGEPSAV